MNQHLLPMVIAISGMAAFTGCQSYENTTNPDPVRRVAFNGDNLDGWRQPTGAWEVLGGVSLDAADPRRFNFEPGYGVMVNGRGGATVNLVSSFEHGDVEAQLEFCVPKGSNSGVYFQGRYEIQIFDSYGVTKPQHSDGGGIYQRWRDDQGFEGHAPRVNASKPPGEWQRLDVVFRAPRFDEHGNKVENARFVSVKLNGVLIHQNVSLSGPTRAALDETSEAAHGPLMLQGDHGPVAYRNLIVREILLR